MVYFLGAPEWPLLRLIFAPINVEFIAGIAAAALFLSGRPIPVLWSVSLSAAFILIFVLSGADRGESWLVGFAIAALLPCLCQAERAGRFKVPGWLVFGGAASYAIYLTHNPLLSLNSRLLAIGGVGWIAALVLSALICALFGAAYYLGWEKPIMRAVKRGSPKTLTVTVS